MDLLEGLFKFLKTQNLDQAESKPVLLTISGGLDSMVMAHLFYRAGIRFAVAHCNFQLRGQESDEDELFVEKTALRYDVPFFVKRFETKDYATSKGISTQMAARELRYAWFNLLAAENGFDLIATAHHLNDSVETALLNFARGTGLAGLSGIAPRTKNLIRPLLFASRSEILEYSRMHEINWREDSSNDSDDYARNFVRHQVVPRLEALNPNFSHTAARNMTRIAEAGNNLTFLLNHWLQNAGGVLSESGGLIEKASLKQLPSPKHALREWLKPYGFDAEQARQIAENLDHTGLELQSEKGFRVLVDREKVLISKVSADGQSVPESASEIMVREDDLMLRLPDGSRLFFMRTEGAGFPEFGSAATPAEPDSILVDAESLQFPLHLRPWRPGDVFQPLGMAGKSQKLQDFFTNQKLSRFEKEAVWLLCNADGTLIWVLGMRQDERFKLHQNTNKVLKINWIK